MYTLEEIKSFTDANNGAISKEVGEGILMTFNDKLASAISKAAKQYYPEICIEIAICNYRVKGITAAQTVEKVAAKFLYDKLKGDNRRGLLKLPFLQCTKDVIKGWMFNEIIRPNEPSTEYEWAITLPNHPFNRGIHDQ